MLTMEATWYDFLDLDLIATAYSVYSIVKHTPEIPRVVVETVERDAPPWSLEEEEESREILYQIISTHVRNKLYFDSILLEAQRKRIHNEHCGHWAERNLEDDIRETHWRNPARREQFQQNRGKTWEKLILGKLPSDVYTLLHFRKSVNKRN